MPELLRQLSEDARIESITASKAIENVIVERNRADLARALGGTGCSGFE